MMDVDHGDDSFDDQLLHQIRQKNNEKAHELLKSVIDPVSKVDGFGNTLLHYAAQCINGAMVEHLIALGAKVDAQNREGQTPLWLAMDSYLNRLNWEAIAWNTISKLLNAKASMHISDNQGKSPLGKALAVTNCNVLLWLLERINNECLGNSEKIAGELIEANSSVYAALYLKNAEVTRILLKSGCPVELPHAIDDSVTTALQLSIRMNDVENVRALLDHGADPNAESELHATPMIKCVPICYYNTYSDKNPEILQLLLDRGANPIKILTKTTSTVLQNRMQMYGVLRSGSRECIRVLLESNFDLNSRDDYGYTALHYVVENERLDVLDEFEGRDFDVDARCRFGLTPLLYAVTYHGDILSMRLLNFLLRHGADPNAKNELGMTVLMRLCRFNFIGLDVPWRDCRYIGKVKRCAEYLLQHGADPQVITPNGQSVFNTEEIHRRDYPVESVLAHLVMLEDGGTPIKEIIRHQIGKYEKYKRTFQTFREQLEAMKKIKIYKSLTLQQLLIGKEGRVKRYLREDGFILKVSRLGHKYTPMPYYRYALRERISRLPHSMRLKKEASVTMTKITGIDFEGYPIILDKIYSYLTNKDLLSLCRIVQ